MSGNQPRYMAFLVRLWQSSHEGEPIWHASVDNPHTAERHYFADLEALFAFIETQTASCGGFTDVLSAPAPTDDPSSIP